VQSALIISVSVVYHTKDLLSLFYRSLSIQAFNDFEDLNEVMQDNPLLDQNDEWNYCWGKKLL
jgi:hypothetical protein